jgi:hypothetical protein
MGNTAKINVPVLWDASNNFRDGEIYSVSVASLIIGIVSRPPGISIPGYPQRTPVDTLQIKDPIFGTLFLTLTKEQYLELIGATQGSPSDTQVINWVGGDTIPAGCTLTSDLLMGAKIISINKGGVTMYGLSVVGDTLDLSTVGCLSEEEAIQIIYKK